MRNVGRAQVSVRSSPVGIKIRIVKHATDRTIQEPSMVGEAKDLVAWW
jgi:hypothetical protein